MTRSKGMVVDEILVLPKIKKLKENMKKILNTTQTTPKPNPIDIKETIPVVDKSMKTTINKHVETLENKTEATKEQGMGYDIVEYIKKTKENISLFELCNFPQQRTKILEVFNPQLNSVREAIKFDDEVNEASIGGKSRSHTLPFLLSFEIFNHNVHNCLVDSRYSSNVMPLSICKKIDSQPAPSPSKIFQLDRSVIKVIGEMKDV